MLFVPFWYHIPHCAHESAHQGRAAHAESPLPQVRCAQDSLKAKPRQGGVFKFHSDIECPVAKTDRQTDRYTHTDTELEITFKGAVSLYLSTWWKWM